MKGEQMFQMTFDERGVQKIALPNDSTSAAIAKRRIEFLNLVQPLVLAFDDLVKQVAAEYRARHPEMPSEEELQAGENERLAFLWVDFIREHTDDFHDCEANRNLLEGSIMHRNEAVTAETLELSFVLEQKNLATRPRLEGSRRTTS
jgi:hypothetical protein